MSSSSLGRSTLSPPTHLASGSPFHEELLETQTLLRDSFSELYSPLSDLASIHLHRVQPHLRAAIVIAAGIGTQEESNRRTQRIALAAALEMQSIALSIHRILLESSNDDVSVDKSLLGSTILTGDYCFSRAAVLATQTDSPTVVTIFSQALRTISEGHLRRLMSHETPAYDEDQELMAAGVQAVAHLVELSATVQQTAHRFIRAALARTRSGTPISDINMQHLSPAQQARWQAFVSWLS